MNRIILAAALAILAAPAATAATDCSNAGTQADMNACAAKAAAAADAELNGVYKEIETRLYDEPDPRKLLIAAEKAWVSFRDAECAFRTSATVDGSIHPTMVSMCLEDLTKARTEQLKVYLKCEEGDLSCPVPPG